MAAPTDPDDDVAPLPSALEALEALAAETEAAIARAEAKSDAPAKSQRLTPHLIAQRCLDPATVGTLDADALATALMSLSRLRLDRLRLESMDGLDVCNSATHLLMQHNRLPEIDGLEFFDRLQYLVVSHNSLTRLSGLSHLTTLQYLDASHNDIASADATALPTTSLMALELTGNPCAEAANYRVQLVGALPKLVFLDEQRVSNAERGLPEEEGEDEEGEEEEGEEEEGEEEEEEAAEVAVVDDDDVPSSSPGVAYLRGAKAQVEAQLAQVDAILMQSGVDINTPGGARISRVAAAPTRGVAAQLEALENSLAQAEAGAAAEVGEATGEGTSALKPLDAADLYGRALEAYGVNSDVQTTQAKIDAIRGRAQERRRQFAEAEALGMPDLAQK